MRNILKILILSILTVCSVSAQTVDNSQYGMVDNLSYTYDGNQVTKVTDAVSGPNYSGAFHFRDGANATLEYEYDQNGNMTKDLNKNISSIQYNLLNLPSKITYSTNTNNPNVRMTDYTYSASGAKLSVTYTNGATATTNQYCGNMLYEDGTLKQILIDGGYITFSGTTPQYHFYLKDHLGNNRVVVSAGGTVEQVNHYYPYGGLMGESTNGDVQRFKYNGKELDRMHGLDWFDYGARHFDAARVSWPTMDPLAEKYYDISPYVYCKDKPVKYIDENGDSTRIYIETNQLGHAWLSVGEGKDMIVYSYGRYNGTDKGNHFSNGDGVLLRLTDKKAKDYMDKKKEGGMYTFVIDDVNDNEVKSYADNVFNSSNTLPDERSMDYNNDSSAHVIDKYKLLSNNCTTFVSDVINKTGSSVLNELRIIPTSSFGTYTSFEVKGRFINPRSLLRHLNNQSHKVNSHVYKR